MTPGEIGIVVGFLTIVAFGLLTCRSRYIADHWRPIERVLEGVCSWVWRSLRFCFSAVWPGRR